MKTTNFATLRSQANEAKTSIKNASIMKYVNLLNKQAKKNEYVYNVPVLEFGKTILSYIKANMPTIYAEVKKGDYFTAKVFVKDTFGRACYKIKSYKVLEDIDNIGSEETKKGVKYTYLKPVTLSEIGLINAYKEVMKEYAKAEDRTICEEERNARKEARKEISKARKEAQKAYNEGRISFAEYSEIMNK